VGLVRVERRGRGKHKVKPGLRKSSEGRRIVCVHFVFIPKRKKECGALVIHAKRGGEKLDGF